MSGIFIIALVEEKNMRIPRIRQIALPNTKVWLALAFFALALLLFISVFRASIFSDVSEEKKIWFELSFLLLAAILAEALVHYLKQPFVMALLVVGVIISPSAIGAIYPPLAGIVNSAIAAFGIAFSFPLAAPRFVETSSIILLFAKLGAILLLFKIGLHSETKKIFNLKNFAIALLGVIVPFVCGYYFAVLSGHSFYYAMFLGAALTATSVGVTVAVLEGLRMLHSDIAQAILGAAVIDDILALLVLSFVQNTPAGFTAAAVAPLLPLAASAIVFVAGGIVLGRFVVLNFFDKLIGEEKPSFGSSEKTPSQSKKGFLAMLAFLFFYAYVAEFIGLSAIVGAFIAGIVFNYSRNVRGIADLFFPLEAFFTPVFFISLGLLVDVGALVQNIVPIAAITLLAIATKVIGCGTGAIMLGSRIKDSFAIGVGMIPRGEIALIIALFGLTALTPAGEPILGAAEYSIIASMAFLTTIIAPLAISHVMKKR